MLKIGDLAPNFVLKNQDDVEINLLDLRGSYIVLYFYPKDNTSGCTKEACEFSNLLSDIEDLNGTVIGISPDSTKSHRNFIEKQNLKITLLSDVNRDVCKSYYAFGIKKMYGKEYEGVIRSTFIIDKNGVIKEAIYNVKVSGHAEYIAKKLNELNSKEN